MSTFQPPKSYETRPVVILGGGYKVHIRDPSEAQRTQALSYVNENLPTFVNLTQRNPGECSVFDDLPSALKDAWLVIEAVPEKLEIKEATFADLEKLAPGDCILATNSSSFKSGELVGRVKEETKKRVLNTHYMMPPEALIVELMTSGHTYSDLFPWMVERQKEAGLHPIVALKESTGFVFNRIWAAIKRETLKVLEEGVSTPAEVDRVFKEQYGAREGPCHMMDNVGLDTVSNIEEHYVKERGISRVHLDWLNEKYVKPGKLGKKSAGKGGLYDVPPKGSQTKLIFLNLGTAEPIDDKVSFDEVLHRGSILTYNPSEGGKAQSLLSHEYMPDGIDIYGDRIYWTDMGNVKVNEGQIFSAKMDGSDIQTVVPKGKVFTPKQLVIDQKAKKAYFCDREGCRVMRVNLDGSELETLVQTAVSKDGKPEEDQTLWCVGIAVSQKLGKIFWTQKGASKASQGRIFSAGLETPKDPANRSDIEVVMKDLPEPIDLEVDEDTGVLYWTDRGELPLGNTLNRKTVAGTVPQSEKKLGRQIIAQGFTEAIGLKVDKEMGCIWVADIGGHIWKCNMDRAALKEKVYESEIGAFTGLTFVRV
ncbi:hypothetical protein PRZ48_011443 [Zasmidium cellare]|uniref:3-hydroxyacyl-CoA dehydrogenase n=1 Tax=Zasmidium cellare TaxID=395010 RepID=A0ABR0E6P6_ZASCE|nr:hypothetical protein PRZ48_011443 [Zasmidium cellare]